MEIAKRGGDNGSKKKSHRQSQKFADKDKKRFLKELNDTIHRIIWTATTDTVQKVKKRGKKSFWEVKHKTYPSAN